MQKKLFYRTSSLFCRLFSFRRILLVLAVGLLPFFVVGQETSGIIQGKVLSSDQSPLVGATIRIIDLNVVTTTDGTGSFSFSVEPGAYDLDVSYVSYQSAIETGVEVRAGERSELTIVLQPDDVFLDEVVVVGYGTMKRRDVLGSIATVSSDDIQKQGATSMDAALQGMASGVTVTSPGMPGAPVQVKVRGINSVSSGTDPLWIIDGIPVSSSSIGGFNGATEQNVLSMFNPADIESIQVLKDAAATSIYGSRGSNGVIVVTTKSGKSGQRSFDVELKTGISNWTKTDIGIASGREFVEIMDLVRANSGLSGLYDPIQSLGQLDTYESVISREEAMQTNSQWADVISRTGNFIDARIAASSGTDKTTSYMSLNYRKDQSNLRYGDMQSLSSNININHKPFNSLTLGYRMLASYTDNNRISSGSGKQGTGGWAQVNSNALPFYRVYNPQGTNGYWNPGAMINPLASMDPMHSINNLQTLNLLSGLTAELQLPVQGLTLKGELGVNYVNSKANSWISEKVRILGNKADEAKITSSILNYNTYFNYDISLPSEHNFNVVAGLEGTRESNHITQLNATDLVGSYPEIGTPGTLSGSSRFGNEMYLMGMFGRANYNYQNRYYAGVSVRRDGISKFVGANRWANFLSGSLGWIVSEEAFFDSSTINLLKLRGSYGQTGNTNIPIGITEDLWADRSGTNTLQMSNSKSLTNIGNENIKWETTGTLDVGVEFGLWNNRVSGSVAWYNQTVKDMLLEAAVPQSAGIQLSNSIWENIGDMVNSGWEVDVRVGILDRGDLQWNVGGNFSTNYNQVLSLTPELDQSGNGLLPSETPREIIRKGLPLGNWYMAEYAGVDAQKGIPMIYEVEVLADGSTIHTGNIIPATTTNQTVNRMILDGKTSIPKFAGGFNTDLTYKGFSVSMIWNFAAGHYIYNRLRQSLMTPNTGLLTLSSDLLDQTWRQPGDDAKYPMPTYGNSYYYDSSGNPSETQVQYGSENVTPNSLYLEKGDYLRLKNLQVGYHFKNMFVYVSGTNLLTFTGFTGYDPEVNVGGGTISSVVFANQMPQSRVFTLGISAKF